MIGPARSLIEDLDAIFAGDDWGALALTNPNSSAAEDLVEFRVETHEPLDVQVQGKLTAAFRVHMPSPYMVKVYFWTPGAAEPYAVGSTARETS